MKIIITTMKSLPYLCTECPCHSNDSVCMADKNSQDGRERTTLDYRPHWCPLVAEDEEG